MTSRLLAAALLSVAVAGPAGAEEPRPEPSASLLLSIGRAAVEHREAAYDQALREPAPPPREPVGVVQPDGSIRYGRMTVTVKEYCPPAHDEPPPPLPGRRARR
jgi:hypothetical protein